MSTRSRARESATAAWRHIFDYIRATAADRVALLERLGLTPAESRALSSLDPGAGRSMRSLADEWSCDPSNATWLVDRLERQGLAKRGSRDGDRRGKAGVLTPKGKKLPGGPLASPYTPPPDPGAPPEPCPAP